MQVTDIVNKFSVLILEESKIHQELFEDWLSGISTRVVSSAADVPTKFDDTVAVACFCQTTLGDHNDDVRNFILTRNPYCQLVAILPRGAFQSTYDDKYDACLNRPIIKKELQETVSNRLLCGVYSVLLREFYDLNANLIWMRRTGKADESLSDVDVDQLREQYSAVSSELDILKEKISYEDIQTISQSIDRHKQYLTKPADDINRGTESKYHPQRCPSCKLPWGVNHRNELGKGMTAIGAGVWKCSRCDYIVHGLGEAGRKVM